MTYELFLKNLGRAGLSVRAFADLVGMKPNSVSNYARNGEVPRHLAMIAALCGEMNVRGVEYHSVFVGISIEAKKSRGAAKPGRFGGDKQEQLELNS